MANRTTNAAIEVGSSTTAGVAWVAHSAEAGSTPSGRALVLDFGAETVGIDVMTVSADEDGQPSVAILTSRSVDGLGDGLAEVWRSLALAKVHEPEGSMQPFSARTHPPASLAAELTHIVLAGDAKQAKAAKSALAKALPDAEVVEQEATDGSGDAGVGVVNRHSPNYSVWAGWTDKDGASHKEQLFKAFTPLYDERAILSGHFLLGYEKHIEDLNVRLGDPVQFWFETSEKKKIRLEQGDDKQISLAARGQDLYFKLYGDQHVLFRVGPDDVVLRVSDLRVDDKGAQHLHAERVGSLADASGAAGWRFA